ncbi:hypothetical protein RJ639_043979 [Escallonia herrerae]|uniref:Uncharacterized protein n=1 Tax=Escallonia herrerae TaxID=1293975 RepID=A0AA88WCM5_9ASTE|nr:hypothetical protein RJ639_043979 [Escallonia herrerae]
MASRCGSISRPALTLLKSTLTKPSVKPTTSFSHIPRSSPAISRQKPISILHSKKFKPFAQMGALQSLLPLHSAVSSARLTSCLGIDSKGSRSLSQGMLCSAFPGV